MQATDVSLAFMLLMVYLERLPSSIPTPRLKPLSNLFVRTEDKPILREASTRTLNQTESLSRMTNE